MSPTKMCSCFPYRKCLFHTGFQAPLHIHGGMAGETFMVGSNWKRAKVNHDTDYMQY